MVKRAITILAIDDLQDNLISLTALVREFFPEAQIYTALSGPKGLDLAAAEDPDVILLDIVMPGMDGYAVCQKLKDDKNLCDTPVVFITAQKEDKERRIRALEVGAEGFLTKPIDETELTAQIRAMVKIKTANRQKRDEKKRLSLLVAEQTGELRHSHAATLDLLDDLHRENVARKKSEEILRDREARMRAITDSAQDAIIMMDQNGHITYWNPAAEQILGYTGEEAMGMHLHTLIAPQRYHATHHAAFAKFQLTGRGDAIDRTIELEARRNNGLEISIELSLSALHLQGSWHSVGIIREITERKRAEAERENLQAQLQQAQKMEAIGTLAGGIAHDFNNILGAILGYAEMAYDDSPPGSLVASDIKHILKAGHRARELVKQILAFSRQAETEQIPMQPAIIIREAGKMLRSSLPTTIAIQQNIDPTAGLILADPTQIHQIVMNLCTNAYHAMEEKGGTLSISLKKIILTRDDLINEPHVQPGDFVQLSFADTGSGIAAEIRERIFEPYFTTKAIGKGTGMGLAIVHGIVKSYGGWISCCSKPGEGTVFHVYLPGIAERDLPEGKTVDPIGHGNEHILLIDDEEMLAEMGKIMLERLGYRVTVRTNSIEALTTFQNQPGQFDLVITDQTMPGMTGSDLARRMLQKRPDLPIILCTGYSSLISEERAKALGIRGFALKPLVKKDMATLIRKVLDSR